MKQGLLPAIQKLLPGAEQRLCMRHLYSNFRKRFVGQKLKNLMWKAATVTHPAAIKFLNLNAEDYIPICFRKSSFKEMYNSIIYPINGKNMWPITDFPDVMPPHKRIMPGRPKKKRRLEQWELRKDDTQLRKGGHRKRCRVCRELGHNRTHCPQLPTQGQSSQPTDGPPQPTQPSQEPISATPQPTQPSQEPTSAPPQPTQPCQEPTNCAI